MVRNFAFQSFIYRYSSSCTHPRTLTKNHMLYLRIPYAAQSHPTSKRKMEKTTSQPTEGSCCRAWGSVGEEAPLFHCIPSSKDLYSDVYIYIDHTYVYIYSYSSWPTINHHHQPTIITIHQAQGSTFPLEFPRRRWLGIATLAVFWDGSSLTGLTATSR